MTSSDQPPSSENSSDETPESPIDLGVISGLRQLYPDTDGGPINQLVRDFLANAQAHLAQIQAAARVEDVARIEQTSHTLRGSSGSLGAHRLSTLSHEIEIEARNHGRVAGGDLLAALAEEVQRVEAAFRSAIAGPIERL